MLETILSWTQLPNLHPLAVHFPIALLPVALLLDVVALTWGRQVWLGRAAGIVYGLAAVSSWVAVRLGELAADSLTDVPPELQPEIALHGDWGRYTAWAMAGLVLLRIGLLCWRRAESRIILRGAVLLLGAAALVVTIRAADLGGGLVYAHGVGVTAKPETPPADERPERLGHHPAGRIGLEALERRAGGGFAWRPVAGDGGALGTVLKPVSDRHADAVSVVDPPGDGLGLRLRVDGRALLLVPAELEDLQLDVVVDLSDFEGELSLAHHVVDDRIHRLFRVDPQASTVELVTIAEAGSRTLDRASKAIPPSVELGVSVAGRHLKGFVDGATVVHGHEPAAEEGGVGLLLEGRGGVVVHSVTLTAL